MMIIMAIVLVVDDVLTVKLNDDDDDYILYCQTNDISKCRVQNSDANVGILL
jgi:hypothetical protein